ncbi:MAG TPA: AtpZ/AtpI family protein [Thermodesulfobacteriota bacterium]|nr:AtpZ/AtpI family protein [Thermodesulfobacteriota bacterium]
MRDPAGRGRRGGWAEATRYAAVGIEVAASVVIGLLMGMGLDRLFGTAPWLALVFLVLGSAAGVRALLRALRAWQREEEGGDAGSGPGGPAA